MEVIEMKTNKADREKAAREAGNGRSALAARETRKRAPLPKEPLKRHGGGLEKVCGKVSPFLRLLMKLKSWTSADMAWVTSLDVSYVRDLEHNRMSNPTLHVLSLMAQAFGVKLGLFIEKMTLCQNGQSAAMPASD